MIFNKAVLWNSKCCLVSVGEPSGTETDISLSPKIATIESNSTLRI